MKMLPLVKTFFSFSKRERTGILVLLFLLSGVLLMQFVLPVFSLKMKPETNRFQQQIDSLYQTDSLKIPGDKFITAGKFHPARRNKETGVKKVEINKADSIELVQVPGIGPVLASRIIKYRKLLGGFVDLKQLSEVYGIHEDNLKNILGYLDLGEADLRKMDIDTCGFRTFMRHPYLGKDKAIALVKFRRQNKDIGSDLNLLRSSGIFDSISWKKIKPYFIERKKP